MCVCAFIIPATRAQSNEEFEKSVRLLSLPNSKKQKSKELCEEETRAIEGESRLPALREFNTRQSLILFYYKIVLLQTASASASANK